jgi:tetratricopeptide (TPR) repeat protein
VDVHLQEVATGKIVFSDKVESPDMNGIFSMVDTITARLVEHSAARSQLAAAAVGIEQIATSSPEAYRRFQAGKDYQRRAKYEEAVREFEEAVRLDPEFALAYLELADVSIRRLDFSRASQALADAERLGNRLPRLKQPWVQLYKSDLANDTDGVAHQLEVILREAPRDSDTRRLLAETRRVLQPVFDEQGIAILREGLALDPKDDQLWIQLAYGEAVAGHQKEALEACDRLQALMGQNDARAWSTRGDVLFEFGRDDEASAAYLRLQELDPSFEQNYATRRLGIIYAEQGKIVLARKELDKLQREAFSVKRVFATVLEAQLLQAQGETDASIPLLRKAVMEAGQDEQSTRAYRFLRWFSVFSAYLGRSESELAFVRRQNLQGRELQFVSALEADAGRERAAEETLQRLVAVSPQIPSSVVKNQRALNHAMAALRRGDGAAALTALKPYAREGSAISRIVRGRAQLRVKDYAAAEQSFREAIVFLRIWWGEYYLPAMEHVLHFHLGQTYEASGRREDAIREYQSFLSHYVNSHSRLPEIKQARAALKRLGA